MKQSTKQIALVAILVIATGISTAVPAMALTWTWYLHHVPSGQPGQNGQPGQVCTNNGCSPSGSSQRGQNGQPGQVFQGP